MRVRWIRGLSGGRGFTLIELLVVVAIIALLISILLPSLGQARSQARSSLCASRIAMITKSMILYADDFDENPPFLGVGHRTINASGGESDKAYWNLGNGVTEWGMAKLEQWLTRNLFPDTGNMFRNVCHTNWSELEGTQDEQRVESGTLFNYARFPNTYRCPEFERVPGKTQNVFNYTRSVLGRKLLSSALNDADAKERATDPAPNDELHPGPIMKISAIYAASAMFMMLDEQWDFHCAGNYGRSGAFPLNGFWTAAETIHGLVGDTVGSYHTSAKKAVPWPEIREGKRGTVGFYDGHVDLYLDPWPWRDVAPGYSIINILGRVVAGFGGDSTEWSNTIKLLEPLLQSCYAQRGVDVSKDTLRNIIMGALTG